MQHWWRCIKFAKAGTLLQKTLVNVEGIGRQLDPDLDLWGTARPSLETWMRAARSKLSRHADVAKAMDYMLKRWVAFRGFVDDGRICMTNNAAERSLRGVAIGRKAWLFAGSDRGGERAAAIYSLIVTAKMNDVDPKPWLADVLARIADHPARRLDELLPWNWRHANQTAKHTIAA